MRVIPAGENLELVGKYVGEKCEATFTPGMYQGFVVLNDDGVFNAAIVVSDFRTHDCQLSCASESKFTWRPHVLKAIFEYVFNQLGCVRCTAISKITNKKARAFLEGMGFQLEGKLRLGYDGKKDALIYGLLASECKYIDHPEQDNVPDLVVEAADLAQVLH